VTEPQPLGQSRVVWSVLGLLQAVGDAIQTRLPSCTVEGEVSGLSRPASGHLYFTLKDANGDPAQLRCAMFRRAASSLDFPLQDGQRVQLRGRLGVYEARGELQMVVESAQRAGAGTLYEQFLKLKARLEAQGLFSAERKRPLPEMPRTVAVVTSLNAAALRDVCTTLARRSPQVQVVVVPSLVQGSEAPASLVAAIAKAGAWPGVDVLIVCRGGGSLEDLWAFNDEAVVRAIVACPVPVICGVGHETDVSLSDFAADLRAATPTAAAELVAPAMAELQDALVQWAQRLRRSGQRQLERQAQGLDRLSLRLGKPASQLATQRRRLDLAAAALQQGLLSARLKARGEQERLGLRLHQAAARSMAQARQRLTLADSRLRLLDPARVLERGYAWLADEHGRAVVSVQQVPVGAHLQGQLRDGRLELEVQAATPTAIATPTPASSAAGRA
jgi:exodeoxyribonuclease VII large subunit